MKFGVKNLCPIQEANLDIGDLTVVCGPNNTGKSYLTCSLFSFLSFMRNEIIHPISNEDMQVFFEQGKIVVDLAKLAESYNSRLTNGNMKKFMEKLPEYLARSSDRIKDAVVSVTLDTEEIKSRIIKLAFSKEQYWPVTENCRIWLKKQKGQETIECRLDVNQLASELQSGNSPMEPPRPTKDVIIKSFHSLVSFLINRETPDAFIITCERTGVSLFLNEFNIFRDLAFSKKEDVFYELADLRKRFDFKGYPLPIRRDQDFVQRLKEVVRRKSFIADDHPHVIKMFQFISGGEYILDEDTNSVRFMPTGTKDQLDLMESSSSVRSLMELNFYLKHIAKRGQILVIDEPEQNLNPANQRKMTYLLAMLVRAGIKVFVTTHSDYIIRELNALVMLNNLGEEKGKTICGEHNCPWEATLDFNSVRCYVMKDGQTHVMEGSPQNGFAVESFDDTIRSFNALHQDIIVSKE
jgi:Uncharacterized conserved protein